MRERPFDFYSVVVAITIVTTPVATTIVAVIPTPVMVVIATVITLVMSSVAMIIKVRHTASQQNSGEYRQQQGCCTLHSNFPNTKVLTTERLSLPAPAGRSARSR